MKSRSLILIFTLFASLFTGNSSLDAATLHAIVVCDTHADGIEKGVKADFKKITKEIDIICNATDLKKNVKAFTGRKVTSDFVKCIDKLNVGPDDVMLFYWSGHGMRFHNQEDPWPVFDFEYVKDEVSQYSVTTKLMQKHPRLILSITDCCNDLLDKSLTGVARRITELMRENYKTLFLYSRGTYMAAAAGPGEFSFGLNGWDKLMNLPPGGLFTNALLDVLHAEADKTDNAISWDLIFTLAKERTEEYQYTDPEDSHVYHHPFFEYFDH